MLRLAGKLKSDFVRQMRAFRDGSRAATVMQQIAKGYDDAQTEALGDFFAAQR
jgi:cytochrome c553